MIRIQILLLCVCTSAICFAKEQIAPTTIDFLYENRQYLAKNYSFRNSLGVKSAVLDSLGGDSLKFWKTNQAAIIGSLIPTYYPKNCIEFRKKIGSIRDTTSLKFLITLLDFQDLRSPRRYSSSLSNKQNSVNWANDAAQWLINAAALPLLHTLSDTLQARLDSSDLSPFLKAQLLSLVSLSDSMKAQTIQSLRSDPTIDSKPENAVTKMWVLSRLGDQGAEKRLIDLFTNAQSFEERSSLIDAISLAGSKECIKTLVTAFDRKIISQSESVSTFYRGYCLSLRGGILIALARHFPDVELFTENRLFFYKLKNYDCDTVVQKSYLTDFQAWAKKECSVDIRYTFENSGPFISGGCTDAFVKQFRQDCRH
ncbi:MAG: hypothetical protein JW795_22095 [Chitinivibrionales bacterium]|nr:hypothetical protein [Chitinivibrionales bacterium]